MPSRLLFSVLVVLVAALAARAAGELPLVEPLDLSRLRPADFADDELELPYYLAHFHRLANAVVAEGEDRGFIALPVWRAQKDNQPYNARIMENCLSLAFFYCTDRPWNPYRGDPAVRQRLEAALDFWCRIQHEDGRFSEYGPGRWNLPATAFATKYMGETLRLLSGGPPIERDLLERVFAAQRKAVHVVLTDPDLYEHGKRYSNQYENVWGGALALLALRPDEEIARLLAPRLESTLEDLQSPAGYFYEQNGPDWSYNLRTHHSDILAGWHYARQTDLAPPLVEKMRRWQEWLGYNAVPEPDGAGWTLNRGVETRQRMGWIEPPSTYASVLGPRDSHRYPYVPTAEVLPTARPHCLTEREWSAWVAAAREELAANWPRVAPLAVGDFNGYSPYAFLHRSHFQWLPSDEQRAAAVAALPTLARAEFTHQRIDSRFPIAYTYVRREPYYAALTSGQVLQSQQRYGLGLLWSPAAGSLLQSQTASASAAFGTRAAGAAQVYEASSFTASYTVAGQPVELLAGNRELHAGDLTVAYPLGDTGQKMIRFGDDAIRVTIRHAGKFSEQLPLLVGPADRLSIADGEATLTRGELRLIVRFDPAVPAVVQETRVHSGPYRVSVLRLPAAGELNYQLTFSRN